MPGLVRTPIQRVSMVTRRSLPQTIPNSDLPVAGLQNLATVPVNYHINFCHNVPFELQFFSYLILGVISPASVMVQWLGQLALTQQARVRFPVTEKYILSNPPVIISTSPIQKKGDKKKIENWIFLSFYFSARVTPSLRGLMDKASVS